MIIKSKRVWINEEFVPASLKIEDGKIVEILDYNDLSSDEDYGDKKIIPGLLDIHAHGYNGMDSNYATEEGLKHWAAQLPKEGVTSFVPSTSTTFAKNQAESFKIIADFIESNPYGAKPIGIHVEGPQISFEFKGAHNPYNIQKPNVDQFIEYQKTARNHIKMICIAPEMDENHELIKYCSSNGVKVVIGHTGAYYDECVQAGEDGATSFTHTFNGMRGVHHREPGVAGAAMSMDNMYAELICDGVHVKFPLCKVVARAKGKDKLILITDAVQIKGLAPGIYEMPGRWVEVKEDGVGRLKDGRLAGSSNKMISMVKNLVEQCDIEEVVAINAATINPANFLGLSDVGLIKEGYAADLVVISDDYDILQTYVSGNKMIEGIV